MSKAFHDSDLLKEIDEILEYDGRDSYFSRTEKEETTKCQNTTKNLDSEVIEVNNCENKAQLKNENEILRSDKKLNFDNNVVSVNKDNNTNFNKSEKIVNEEVKAFTELKNNQFENKTPKTTKTVRETLVDYQKYVKRQIVFAKQIHDVCSLRDLKELLHTYESSLLVLDSEIDVENPISLNGITSPYQFDIKVEKSKIADEEQITELITAYKTTAMFYKNNKDYQEAKNNLRTAISLKRILERHKVGDFTNENNLPGLPQDFDIIKGKLDQIKKAPVKKITISTAKTTNYVQTTNFKINNKDTKRLSLKERVVVNNKSSVKSKNSFSNVSSNNLDDKSTTKLYGKTTETPNLNSNNQNSTKKTIKTIKAIKENETLQRNSKFQTITTENNKSTQTKSIDNKVIQKDKNDRLKENDKNKENDNNKENDSNKENDNNKELTAKRVEQLNQLIAIYEKKALEYKTDGNSELTKECLKAVILMEKALQTPLEFDFNQLPPNNPEKWGLMAEIRNQTRLSKLEKIFQRQKRIMTDKMRLFKNMKDQKQFKDYKLLSDRTEKDLKLLKKFIEIKSKCPNIETKNLLLKKEARNMDIPFNKILLKMTKCNLVDLPFYKKKPVVYVNYSFDVSKEDGLQEGSSKRIKKLSSNQFEMNERILISVTRKKGLAFKIRQSYIYFTLMQHGVFKDTKYAKGELKLTKLFDDIKVAKKIRLKRDDKTVGELFVEVEVNVPFGKLKFIDDYFKFCILKPHNQSGSNETNKTLTKMPVTSIKEINSVSKNGDSKPIKNNKNDKNDKNDKSKLLVEPNSNIKDVEKPLVTNTINLAVATKKKQAKPVPKKMLQDPLNISFYISNDVLEYIKKEKTNAMNALISKGKIPSEKLCSEIREATAVLARLEQSVEDGEISLEKYLDNLRQSVENLDNFLLYLDNERAKYDDKYVKEVLVEIKNRLGVMKKELKDGESMC